MRQTLNKETLLTKVKSERFLRRLRTIIASLDCDLYLKSEVPNAFDKTDVGTDRLFGARYFTSDYVASGQCVVVLCRH